MKWYEKVLILLLLVAAVYIIGAVGQPANGQATIEPIMIGEWRVGQGYISTSPEGDRYACEVGDYGEGRSYPFELDEMDVYLRCVPFVDDKPYAGKPDGELVRLLSE